MTQRIEYDKPNRYCDKVLVGSWVTDRINSSPVQTEDYPKSSTYADSYDRKPLSRIDPSVVWDQKLNSEESNCNFISQIRRNDLPNYFENFTSTYDLSYNHFPKCFKGHINRTLRFRQGYHEPTEDYIPSFGNMTNYGLIDDKKQQWECEVQDPRKNNSTHYKDTFMAPDAKDYAFRRFATPKANSSVLNTVTLESTCLKLRDRPVFGVTPAFSLVQVPRPSTWNPITWECIPETPPTPCPKKCT
ncbi:uncharacterized protein [Tenebrio molitor]|uniref:uncharacterized protein n=1 Tax=Tenebrio molitor TaxID=7067 RepID=UPI00362477ED